MTMGRAITRIILDICICLSIIHGWWFVAAPLMLVGLWSFRYFSIESIIAGIFYDGLFGMPQAGLFWSHAGLIISIIAIGIIVVLKHTVRP